MSEQKIIKEKIKNVLSGESLNNALDFIAFLYTNELQIDSHGDGEGWAGAIGGLSGIVLAL